MLLVSSGFAPLLLLAALLATDAWVYSDARRAMTAGAPVRMRVGTFVIETPSAWLISCLVLWIPCFPAYLVSRRS